MKGTIKSSVICVLLVLSIVMFASCKKKINTEQEAVTETQEIAVEETKDLESVAVEEEELLVETNAGEDTEAKNDAEIAQLRDAFENTTISFAYDSSDILESEIAILEVKAEWLRDNADVNITIEGHCDERGTTEYNLALGDRRAARVKSFLRNLGLDSDRITTISYGEESPAASGNNETAWAQNRRAKCVID